MFRLGDPEGSPQRLLDGLVVETKQPRTIVNIKATKLVNGRPAKRCPKCGETKDLDDFGLRYMQRPDGTQEVRDQSRCRNCR